MLYSLNKPCIRHDFSITSNILEMSATWPTRMHVYAWRIPPAATCWNWPHDYGAAELKPSGFVPGDAFPR